MSKAFWLLATLIIGYSLLGPVAYVRFYSERTGKYYPIFLYPISFGIVAVLYVAIVGVYLVWKLLLADEGDLDRKEAGKVALVVFLLETFSYVSPLMFGGPRSPDWPAYGYTPVTYDALVFLPLPIPALLFLCGVLILGHQDRRTVDIGLDDTAVQGTILTPARCATTADVPFFLKQNHKWLLVEYTSEGEEGHAVLSTESREEFKGRPVDKHVRLELMWSQNERRVHKKLGSGFLFYDILDKWWKTDRFAGHKADNVHMKTHAGPVRDLFFRCDVNDRYYWIRVVADVALYIDDVLDSVSCHRRGKYIIHSLPGLT